MIDINKAIEQLDWSKEPKGLYEPIGYTLAAGGKRIRPRLALLGAMAVGERCAVGGLNAETMESETGASEHADKNAVGGCIEAVMPAAMALEVFHNFTLLHDDVMDKAEVRRGRATVHVKWNALSMLQSITSHASTGSI